MAIYLQQLQGSIGSYNSQYCDNYVTLVDRSVSAAAQCNSDSSLQPNKRFIALSLNKNARSSINRNNNVKLRNTNVNGDGLMEVPQIVRPITSFKELLAEARAARNAIDGACNVADSLIGWLLADPRKLRPSNDPKILLSGNYAPVAETPPTICSEIEGVLPPDLDGMYVRNGPNPTRLFAREGYHMFDGDGMLHGVLIRSGVASYCSRHVRTSRFIQEEIADRPLFIKLFGGLYGLNGLARTCLLLIRATLGVLNLDDGCGLSNTSVCFFGGKLLSLSDEDLPYVIQVTNDGDFVTIGRLKFSDPHLKNHNQQTFATHNMCSHPKVDPSTGEMLAFSIKPSLTKPFYFYSLSSTGIKSRDVEIPLQEISFIHDFAITPNYAIFPDNQFVIKPWKVLRGQMPVMCDKNKTTKFCVIPRVTLGVEEENQDISAFKPIVINAPNCNSYHFINAWEEGDEIVLISPILSPPEKFLEIPTGNVSSHLSEIRLNLTTKSTSVKKLSTESLDFGTFNQNYIGHKTRYVYLIAGGYPGLSSIVKVDLDTRNCGSYIIARQDFGGSCHCSEPFFVPRSPHEGQDSSFLEEDDGYILSYVYNSNTRISKLVIMDAKSNSLEILASITLPSRIPYGFHGCFIQDLQLATQLY